MAFNRTATSIMTISILTFSIMTHTKATTLTTVRKTSTFNVNVKRHNAKCNF
jgi:hypothetical protein